MRKVLFAVLIAAPALASAQVKASTGSVVQGVSSIYTAEKLRDPFMRAASGSVAKSSGTVEFSIHGLVLRGLMRDAGSEYAVFDNDAGTSYVLRQGRLYNSRGKALAGVSGKTNVKQKTASLITQDQDVQVFRLGAEDKEQKK